MSSEESEKKIFTGTCLCNSVKLILHGEPQKVYACHCLDCQKSAGGPYQVSLVYETKDTQVINPENKINEYIYPKETVLSGFEKRKYFCSGCGTHLFNKPMKFNGERFVAKIGILDPPEGHKGSIFDLFKCDGEVFTKDRSRYCSAIEGAVQYKEGLN